jgi:hypothetical protein
MRIVRYLCLLCGFSLISCTFSPERIAVDRYYPLDSLLKAQTQLLIDSAAHLEKRMILNGDMTNRTWQPDSVEWVKNMGLLYQMDPNQAEYVNAFRVTEDTLEGRNRLVYEAVEGQHVALRKFSIEKEEGVLVNIKAEMVSRNWVESQKKWFNLRFTESVLSQYQVLGGKKQVFSDSSSFSVDGFIHRKVSNSGAKNR